MKSKLYADIVNGKIYQWTDSSHEKELTVDEIPLTSNEYQIISAVFGDLDLAEMIVRDLKERIAKRGATA